MKNVLFSTGNERKIGEARAGCHDFGIEVEQVTLDIDEIQSHNPTKILAFKTATRLSDFGWKQCLMRRERIRKSRYLPT